jgi:hypothetical protein
MQQKKLPQCDYTSSRCGKEIRLVEKRYQFFELLEKQFLYPIETEKFVRLRQEANFVIRKLQKSKLLPLELKLINSPQQIKQILMWPICLFKKLTNFDCLFRQKKQIFSMRITSEMNGDLKYSELDCFKCPVLPHGF